MRTFLQTLVFISFFSFQVQAQPAPCQGDIVKFCKDIPSGGGKIVRCLKKHMQELSPECRAHHDKMRAVRSACGDDFKKFCKGEKGMRGRKECMKKHESQLSPSCKSQL